MKNFSIPIIDGFPTDTPPHIEAAQIALLKKSGVAGRVKYSLRLSRDVIRLSRRAIRRRNPNLSERNLNLRYVEYFYGRELSAKLRERLERLSPNE